MFVDVWDGDSLLQLGTMAVELRPLLRQGEPVVRSAMEYDVVGMTAPNGGKEAMGNG